MRGDHWTQANLRTLKDMVERDVEWHVIAGTLRRSKGACMQTAKRNGYRGDPNRVGYKANATRIATQEGWSVPMQDAAFVRRLIREAVAAGVMKVSSLESVAA